MKPRGRKTWHSFCQVSVCLTRHMSSFLEPEIVRITPLPLWNSAEVLQYGFFLKPNRSLQIIGSIFTDKKRGHPSRNWNLGLQRTVFCELRNSFLRLRCSSSGLVFPHELCDLLWKASVFAMTQFPLLASRHWKLLFCSNYRCSCFEYHHLKAHQHKLLVLHP